MTMNSTISELVQDNSSIEYVSPETNPMDTVQNSDLVFGQKHNDIDCVLCPTAKRACDRALFTEEQICEWSRMSATTLWRRLEKLEKVSRVCILSDVIEYELPTNSGGYIYGQLYNLNVLNQLAMVCIDNENLNDISCKFSDILSEVGTTGSYSIRKPDSYMIEDKIERAKRWVEETEEWLKALSVVENAYDETKALLAEEREYFEMLSEAVDDLVRTTARINDKKVASAMGTAGAKSKESEGSYMTARDWCLKHKLPVSTNEPEWTVSAKLTDICITFPEREQWHLDSSGTKLFPQWACNILDRMYESDDSTFLADYRTV